VIDISQSREDFSKDLEEAFSEIAKWRKDKTHLPPMTYIKRQEFPVYEKNSFD
jgi:hypothetical protein